MSYPEAVPDPSLEVYDRHLVSLGLQTPYQTPGEKTGEKTGVDSGLIPITQQSVFQQHDEMDQLVERGPGWTDGKTTVLGMRRKAFWVLLGVALVVVGASVGGGVGGGMAAARSHESAATTTSASPTSSVIDTSPTSRSSMTTKKATTTSTLHAPTATFLNNQTYTQSGFAFQAFSGTEYTGRASSVVRGEGFRNLPFASASYVWLTGHTDCCITFCSDDATAVGWWCSDKTQPASSAEFGRVWIGCGVSAQKAHACS